MSKFKVDPETLILLKGEMFVLVKESSQGNYIPCMHCDLRFRCKSSDGRKELISLCVPANRDGSYFFKKVYIYDETNRDEIFENAIEEID